MVNYFTFFFVKLFLGVKVHGSTAIVDLQLDEYTEAAFDRNNIVTVKDAVLAHTDTNDYPGIGDRTWEKFFDVVRMV